MKKIMLITFIIVALLIAFSGCVADFIPDDNGEEETGKINVYMTDAILPLDEVEKLEVTIEGISLYGGGASPVV
ncbi:MAG: DUF4382 domain-containing protein, partial [Kosmotoga sp.]